MVGAPGNEDMVKMLMSIVPCLPYVIVIVVVVVSFTSGRPNAADGAPGNEDMVRVLLSIVPCSP